MVSRVAAGEVPEDAEVMDDACDRPGHIRAEDLMAFVDGTADEVTREHIRHCHACAREAQEMATLEAILSAGLYRYSCPSFEQLYAYQQGELVDSDYLIVSRHVRQCPHCAQELAALAREERRSLGERLHATLQVISARPMGLQIQPAGARGQGAEDSPRPEIYGAGEVELLVTLRPAVFQPGEYDLAGLVHTGGQVPQAVGTAKVELYRGQDLVAITSVSPRGQFTILAVEPGCYELVLLWEHREIHLEGVQVGPQRSG